MNNNLVKPAAKTAEFCTNHKNTRLVYRPGEKPVLSNEMEDIGSGVWVPATTRHCPVCRMSRAGCPRNLCQTSFGTFDTSSPERVAALAAVKDFVNLVHQSGRGFALFVGLPGMGKTRLACNSIGEMAYRGSLYTRQGELTLALRGTYARKEIIMRRGYSDDEDEGSISPPQPLVKTRNAGFLVLDEIGCNPLANDERLLIDELIKHRYDNGKPTILISNLPLDKFKEFLGDALIDRIKHASGNGRFIIQFAGESYRRSDGEGYFGEPA